MKDFFKYLTPGEEDQNWGLYLTVAGRSTTKSDSVYPSSEHPTGYYFSWKKGRILQEYQLVYITEGRGILETRRGSYEVKEGTIIMIRPGEYHRYRPLQEEGWLEHFIGFNGRQAQHFFKRAPYLRKEEAIICGIRESFMENYYKIFRLVKDEKPGFQQIASGHILALLGGLVAFHKQGEFSGKPIESSIQKARLYMREHVEENIDLHELAAHYHLSYASFRKMFKKYTGKSPRQYHLELKLMRAKELLLTSDLSITEISHLLNFESLQYFSRYFKKQTGSSPRALRKTIA